jgi:2-C-methyl-D-erythritol 4-phosphate cytidylyltransferase
VAVDGSTAGAAKTGGAADTWAVVVAAGDGNRFGSHKQFAELAGRRVFSMAVEAARSVAAGVVLVVPPATSDSDLESFLEADLVVRGGATRADSVRAGLMAVPADAEIVVVHDAARPLASARLFESVTQAVRDGADAVVPALRVRDTLKRVDGDVVVETVPRADLVAVQTPQAFRAEILRRAHAGSLEATDDAALVESLGATVRVVEGEAFNLKLTEPGDVRVLEALMAGPFGS